MSRKAKPKSTRTLPAAPFKIAILLGVVIGCYCAIVWLGEKSRDAVSAEQTFKVNFDAIDCATPPGMDRLTFLNEVRYLGQPPREFSSVDAAMPTKLAESFARHPWVLKATPNEATVWWPKPVWLEFRKPALTVTTNGGVRVVDTLGVLMPQSAKPDGLPKFMTPQTAPGVDAGERWPNADVRRAVELVRDYPAKSIEKTANGWRIEEINGRFLTLSR